MMLKSISVLSILSVAGLYGEEMKFILGPAVADSGAVDSSLSACIAPVQSTISRGLESAFKSRLRVLSSSSMLSADESLLLVLPTITLLRDFREIVAGRIVRHSVALAGHVQIVDPWTRFALDSVPWMVEAQVDIGAENSAREDAILQDACLQAAQNWTVNVAERTNRIPFSSSGPVSLIPNPKSFQRKTGATLLAGADKHLKPRQIVASGGDYFEIVDVQPTFSILESKTGGTLKAQAIVSVPRKDSAVERPSVEIDASALATVLNGVDPDISPQMSKTQLAGIFAGYLAKNEVADLLMESASEADNPILKEFFSGLNRLSLGRAQQGGPLLLSRNNFESQTRSQKKNGILIVLRLSAYDHAIQSNPDGSVNHKFSLAISAELVSPDLKQQVKSAFQGEIRQRIEKQGIREIDNKMTMAYLARSVLLKLATDLNGYIGKEYTAREIGQKETLQVSVGDAGGIAWPKQPQALIRLYRPTKLHPEEQQLLKVSGPQIEEFQAEVAANELPGKIATGKDVLRYEVSRVQTPQVKIAVDMSSVSMSPFVFGGLLQPALEKAMNQPVYLQYVPADSLPSDPGPSIRVAVSEVTATLSAQGCVVGGIVRLSAASTGADVASPDKTKRYYMGKKLQSSRLNANEQGVCIGAGFAQFVQTLAASLDGAQLRQALFKK